MSVAAPSSSSANVARRCDVVFTLSVDGVELVADVARTAGFTFENRFFDTRFHKRRVRLCVDRSLAALLGFL